MLVAPLMPGINDSPEQVSEILELATEAGAVIGEAESGELTGYRAAGLIAAISTGISMFLAGGLRVAQESAETSMAVDSPDESPVLAQTVEDFVN